MKRKKTVIQNPKILPNSWIDIAYSKYSIIFKIFVTVLPVVVLLTASCVGEFLLHIISIFALFLDSSGADLKMIFLNFLGFLLLEVFQWYKYHLNVVVELRSNSSSHRRCSMKKLFLQFCNIHRETPMLKSLFNKVAGLRPANVLATPILRNFCEWLLLAK